MTRVGPRAVRDEETMRSGVKTQRRREGIGVGVETPERGGRGGGCTWKRRMFWFSMRWRRREAIQGDGGKESGLSGWAGVVDGAVGVDVETPTHHFQIRWPEEEGSGAPRMWEQCVQWRAVGEVY